ncbi:MAG: hypothetical protein ACJAV2_004999, partial [Myxococcota bacterium]
MLVLLLSLASAGDLDFSPDRGAIGDSTTTPGIGHVILEAGVSAVFDDTVDVGTAGLVGRFGVDDGVELRLRLPDIRFADGVSNGSFGFGAKFAATAAERWGVSMVPELRVDPSNGDLGVNLSANLSFGLERFSAWAQSEVLFAGEVERLFVGLGASLSFGSAAAYVNVGKDVPGGEMVGGGGTFLLSDSTQVDVGVDLYNQGES